MGLLGGGYIGHVEEYDMPLGGQGWYLILTWTKGNPKIADTTGQKMERVFTGMRIDSR
jgi:hypothetical protein